MPNDEEYFKDSSKRIAILLDSMLDSAMKGEHDEVKRLSKLIYKIAEEDKAKLKN